MRPPTTRYHPSHIYPPTHFTHSLQPTNQPTIPNHTPIKTKTGFRRLATVPKAARLRGEKALVDAHMYHYDLMTYRGRGPPPLKDDEDDDDQEEETPLSFSPASFAAFWRGLLPKPQPHTTTTTHSTRRAFLTGLSVGLGVAVSTLAILRRARLLSSSSSSSREGGRRRG